MLFQVLRVIRYAFACALLLSITAYGQSTRGTFTGTVADTTGAVVPNARVTITNAATGVVTFTGTTNDEGGYIAPELPVGTYNIAFEAANFKTTELRNVSLAIDQRAVIDATLEAGAVSEVVTVSGENLGQLERETSSIEETLNPSQLQDLPLPNRNALNLLNLVAGVSAGGPATSLNGAQISVNGSRTLNNEVTVDGVSVVAGDTGQLTKIPSAEALREFKVQTSAYSAEYGRTSGAYISALVDSGTSEYHGGLYELFRNEKLNANDFFRNSNPATPRDSNRRALRIADRFNLFGGKFGGPLPLPRFGEGGPVFRSGKQGTFFFVHYEGLRQRSPGTRQTSVPDLRFRDGNFSSILAGADGTVGTSDDRLIRDPQRTGNCNFRDTTACFPNNIIPANRLDPAARQILGLLPTPNSPGNLNTTTGFASNNYVNNESVANAADEINLRIDNSSANGNARTFGRFSYSNSKPGDPFDLPNPFNTLDAGQPRKDYQLAIGHTQVLSANLLFEANLGILRSELSRTPTSLGTDVATVLGIGRAAAAAPPRISISGFSTLGISGNPLFTLTDKNIQASAALNYVRSNNTMRFGFQLRRNAFDSFSTGNNFAGSYSFTGEFTAPTGGSPTAVNGLADFLLGLVRNSRYDIPQPTIPRRNYNLGFFVQDDYKFSPRLTFNLGLRYEYEAPLTVANDIYSRVDPVNGELLVAGRTNPRTGRAVSRSLDLEADKLNFAPRAGIAFSFNDKTVLRSAFGIFYSQVFSNLGGVANFPGFTTVGNFGNLSTTSGVPIPQAFTLSQGAPLTAVQNFDDPFAAEREALARVARGDFSNLLSPGAQFAEFSPLPYVMQYNAGIQRELPGAIIIDVSYVGSRGVHLPLGLPTNVVPLERAEAVGFANSPAATQAARQFPVLGSFGSIYNAGSSTYNSLQIKSQRQFSRDFAFLTTYTFSKSIDDGSGVFNFSQPNGLDSGQFPSLLRNLDRAISAFDRPHSFALSVQYTTRRGLPGFLRGFQINPLLTARSGLPDTITQNNTNPSVNQQRPSVRSSNSIYASELTREGNGLRYLLAPSDPNFPLTPSGPLFTGTGAQRRTVLPLTIGSLGRNTIRGPREINLDVSVSRRFRFTESVGFQLRVDALNALNRVNFLLPNTGLNATADANGNAFFNSPTFGLITAAQPARRLQIVARFEF